MKTHHIVTAIICIFSSIFLLHSCKTEYIDIKRPYNEIQRFAVSGYGDLDSINAVINDENIIVYWNADAEKPTTITPTIHISETATISPASGESVPFSENTTYTVTAEDGSIRTYKLKPVFNKTIPTLFSAPLVHEWKDSNPISIVGEYFLAAGDFSAIKVYGQRIRDGFEFDIPIDAEKSTATKLIINLPKLTNDLDTGAHRIYVKVGDFSSNFLETWIYQPSPNIVFKDSTIINKHGIILLGEEITFEISVREGMEDIAKKYYGADDLRDFYMFGFLPPGGAGYTSLRIPNDRLKELVTIVDDFKFKVKLDPQIFGPYENYRIVGVSNAYHRQLQDQVNNVSKSFMWNDRGFYYAEIKSPGYTYDPTISLLEQGQQVSLDQSLTINYAFSTPALHTQYTPRLQYVYVIFKDPTTGSEETIRFSVEDQRPFTNTPDESKVVFKIPANLTRLKGKTIEGIGLSFYDIRTRTYKQPRAIVMGTSVANN